jgi:hypothetical protein
MTALKKTIDRLLDAEPDAELLGFRPSTIRDCWRIGKLHWESKMVALIPRQEKGQAK